MMPSGESYLVPRTETWPLGGISKPEARSEPPPPKFRPRAEVLSRSKLPVGGGYKSRDQAPEAEEDLLVPDFDVDVDRSEGRSLGIEVVTEGTLIVMSINEGLIQEWNAANPDKAIEEKDHIVGANDVRGDVDSILDQCRQEQPLRLTVRRPAVKSEDEVTVEVEYNITLDRTGGQKLGIDVEHECGKQLFIESIDAEGLVAAWSTHNPDRQVHLDDRIVEVNGVRGETQLLLAECMREVVLEITLIRTELKGS